MNKKTIKELHEELDNCENRANYFDISDYKDEIVIDARLSFENYKLLRDLLDAMIKEGKE